MVHRAPSPEPTNSVPSGAERTVPMEWVSLSEGMQSSPLDGAGQPSVWMPSEAVPRITCWLSTWSPAAFSRTRSSCEFAGSPDWEVMPGRLCV